MVIMKTITLSKIPNIEKVAERFVELEILIDKEYKLIDKHYTGDFTYVKRMEHQTDELITAILLILGTSVYGGFRQWLREELRKMVPQKST